MKFIIKDISSSRTEIRLSVNPVEINNLSYYIFGTNNGSFDNDSIDSRYIPIEAASYISQGPNPGIIRLLTAYLKDSLTGCMEDYILSIPVKGAQSSVHNYSNPIVNIMVDDINLLTLDDHTVPTFLVKLSKKLPDISSLLDEVSLEQNVKFPKLSLSKEDSFSILF